MPKVSFILPAYKRRFLKEAIDSIFAQTCWDFELVVVDDKSPEDLYEVIKEYPWERDFTILPDGGRKWVVNSISVRYYRNKENIGGKDLVAAWNHAMEYATGEWCVLASDDDVYLPGFLSEMVRLSAKYPQTDLFHARSACIDSEGEWQSVSGERIEFESQVQMVYRRAIEGIPQFAPDFFFRRSALAKIGGFISFPSAWYSDDATWMALAKKGVGCSSEVLFLFRMSGDNISSRSDNAEIKIAAGKQYKKWLSSFVPTLKSSSAEDDFLLSMISIGSVHGKVNRHGLALIRRLPFFHWLRLIRQMDIPPSLRREGLYMRYGLIRELRRIMPF